MEIKILYFIVGLCVGAIICLAWEIHDINDKLKKLK